MRSKNLSPSNKKPKKSSPPEYLVQITPPLRVRCLPTYAQGEEFLSTFPLHKEKNCSHGVRNFIPPRPTGEERHSYVVQTQENVAFSSTGKEQNSFPVGYREGIYYINPFLPGRQAGRNRIPSRMPKFPSNDVG